MSSQKKPLTPRSIALLLAVSISLLLAVLLFFFGVDLTHLLIITGIVFVIAAWLIEQAIRSFLQHRIRMIYKLIQDTRVTKKQKFYHQHLLPEKDLETVEEDVTQWAEQHQQELETIQQNETYRKEFLQNLGHELKTPVFAIQGYVETLADGAINNPDVNQRFLQKAAKNIERLSRLLEDLDEISRLETGTLSLKKEPFSIHHLTEDVLETLEVLMREKNIRTEIKSEVSAEQLVVADKEKIRQVLINLIDNAIKYGKQDGKIDVAFFRLDTGELLIEISDDGMGIAEDQKHRIFERFYRTDFARSRKIGGSGLGLAICKHILDAHARSIHVRSMPDVGTTFVFSLPTA
jgi:two-component system phosphate regulon sensor histidine kinase PhoR